MIMFQNMLIYFSLQHLRVTSIFNQRKPLSPGVLGLLKQLETLSVQLVIVLNTKKHFLNCRISPLYIRTQAYLALIVESYSKHWYKENSNYEHKEGTIWQEVDTEVFSRVRKEIIEVSPRWGLCPMRNPVSPFHGLQLEGTEMGPQIG